MLSWAMAFTLTALSASAPDAQDGGATSIASLESAHPPLESRDTGTMDSDSLPGTIEGVGADPRIVLEGLLKDFSRLPTLLESREVELLHTERDGFRYGVSLVGKVSFFEGDTQFNKDHLGYADVFRTGLGVSAEAEVLTKIGQEWWCGAFLSLGEDTFGGGATNTDSLGVTVKPDDLTVLSVLVGPKTGFVHDNLFGEVRLGIGLAHYLADKATIDTGGGPVKNQEFLRATDRLAAELGGRFGWGTPSLFFDLGLGFRVQGAPERGSKANALVNPESMVTIFLEFGLTLRF